MSSSSRSRWRTVGKLVTSPAAAILTSFKETWLIASRPTPAVKISLTLREQDFACRGWAHHKRRIPCQIWKRPFANAPTTSGSPTVKLNDLDPQAWLADVLARIADNPQNRLHELLPWEWKTALAKSAA